MKTITILALLLLTVVAQAKALLPKHEAKSIVEMLQQTVRTGSLGEIREALKIASDYGFKSEHGFTISQAHYVSLLEGGRDADNPQEAISFLKELAAKANKIDGESMFRINPRDFDLALQNAKKNADPEAVERAKIIDTLAYEFVKAAFEYDIGIDYRDFDGVMVDVAENKDPEAIDLLVELGEDKQHPFNYLNAFGRMLIRAASSGQSQNIDKVMEHADRQAHNIGNRNFTTAIKFAAEKEHIETMKHIFNIATERGLRFTADDFGIEILPHAVQSGDPKTIALVVEFATEHGVKFNSKRIGFAMQSAALKNEQVMQQMIELATKHGVTIDHKYFVEALTHAAANYSGSTNTLDLVVAFAAEQGVQLNINDFSSAMAKAARYNDIEGVRKVFELAAEDGVTLGQKHFVAAMKAAAKGDQYKTIDQMLNFAADRSVDFKTSDFVDIMIATKAYDYKKLAHINKIADKYGFKLSKEHLIHLLASLASLFGTYSKENVDAVIKFANSLEFEVDAEYFEETILYAKKIKSSFRTIEELQKIAADHGVSLSDQVVESR